ncbi:serine/threonine-protein phosphatase with EF-hands 2-like isoform X1 [Stigmatopora argus]
MLHKLYNFFSSLMDHFTPTNRERNLISHLFRENDICHDTEWERFFCYKSVEVPDSYLGPRLTFPMTFCDVSKLVEAFKRRQVSSWNNDNSGPPCKYLTQSFPLVAPPHSLCSATS